MPMFRAAQIARPTGPLAVVGNNQFSVIQTPWQHPFVMSAKLFVAIVILIAGFSGAAEAGILFSGEQKLNNLVSVLLEVASISESNQTFTFTRSSGGWIFISSTG